MAALKFYLRNPLEPPRITPDGWRSRAACAGHPLGPQAWDDKVGPDDVREDAFDRARRVAQAKAVCARCPVAAPCYADVNLALDEGVRAGVDLRAVRVGRAS